MILPGERVRVFEGCGLPMPLDVVVVAVAARHRSDCDYHGYRLFCPACGASNELSYIQWVLAYPARCGDWVSVDVNTAALRPGFAPPWYPLPEPG